jgi:sugar transferase (PEP-CTERM/EpsH1 system associated)
MTRLKVLWLSHFVPYPPKGGCFQRSYHLIRRTGANHDVHLIAMQHKSSTHPIEELQGAREELLHHCRSVDIVDISSATEVGRLPLRALSAALRGNAFNVSIYASPEMRFLIRKKCQEIGFDVVHFDTIGLAQYFSDVKDVPKVLTHHGAESNMIRRRIRREPNFAKKAFFLFEWLALERYERRMCPRADANIVMSEDDGRLLAAVSTEAIFTAVDNGVDLRFFKPLPPARSRSLIFAGRLDQYSNRDGILFFMKEVWPTLRARYSDVTITIVGSNPPGELVELAEQDRQVQVTGFVPDIRPYFAEASAVVCPLRDGGGTRIKVLDAMALGRPIVATTIACEGLEVVPERDLLVANSASQFISQIGRLFEQPGLCGELARNARRLVESRYDWDVLARKLADVYASVTD